MTMKALDDAALDQIFRAAHTHTNWSDRVLEDQVLREIYDIAKWGPTSANATPARFVIIRSAEAKERLRSCLAPGNVDKTMAAPATVIVAYDLNFYEKLPKLFPPNPGMRDLFAGNAELAETTARRNSSLQGAYFIIAARAMGVDCGPMSGFNNAKLDEEFFGAGLADDASAEEFFPEGKLRSNFLINLGYGDPAKEYPRGPRLTFDEACAIL